jgi:hypothetical protein
MRNIPIAILMTALAGSTWLAVNSDEQLDAAKPQAKGARDSKKREPAAPAKEGGSGDDQSDEPLVKAIVSGKVLPLGEALKQRGIKSYAEEVKGQVVLVTRSGELIPIVPDWRGRAFYQDERLRNRPVDLVVNRRAGVPWVQVISIYTFDEKGVRNITDYWCDICAIPMYEIKDCECCQGPTRLRFRPQDLPKDAVRSEEPEIEKSTEK